MTQEPVSLTGSREDRVPALDAPRLREPRYKALALHLPHPGLALWGLLGLCAALPVMLITRPPFHDYYEWVFQAGVVRSLLLGESSSTAGLYQIIPAPVPNSAAPLGIALLSIVLPLRLAGAVFMVLCVALFAGGLAYLQRSIQRQPTILEFLGFTWALGYFLYKGYDSYLFALGLALLTVGLLQRQTAGATTGARPSVLLLLALLGSILFICHLLGWTVLALTTVVYAALLGIRRRRGDAVRLLATLAPATAMLAWYAAGRSGDSSLQVYTSLSDKFISLIEPLSFAVRPDPFTPLLPPLVVNAVVGAAVVGLLTMAWRRRAGASLAWPLLVAGGILGALAVALPISEYSLQVRPDERLVLPAALLLLAAVPLGRITRAQALGGGLLIVLLSGYHLLEWQQMESELVAIDQATAPAIPINTTVLALTIDPGSTHAPCASGPNLPAIGTTALQWFALDRVLDHPELDVSIDPTALLRRSTLLPPAPGVSVQLLTPSQVQASALSGAAISPRYQRVELFGCPQDTEVAEIALAPQYKDLIEGRYFEVLQPRLSP